MLIGRKEEKQLLISLLKEEESSFVAIYGRRRVGKTYLVRETLGQKFTFYHTGLANSPLKKQLAAWRSSLRDSGMSTAQHPHTWLDAFDMLKELINSSTEEKKVLFIDEMPWMDTHRSGFVQALEHFWNGWASARKDIILLVCGSATSWIIKKVIKNHGGLHNRVTQKIHLQPFSLKECEEYSKYKKLGMNRRQIMECYMIIGGVPFYWSLLQKGLSLAQNIDNLFFRRDAILSNEFMELYASLFSNPEPYLSVVNALGTKKGGLTRQEIIAESKLTGNGKLTEILDNLESCGFIRRFNIFGKKERGALFQLIDSFTLFYYRFLQNRPSHEEHFWMSNIGSPEYYNWCGLAFERVCLLHIPQIKNSLGIAGVVSRIFSWNAPATATEKGVQIDLIIDRNDNIIDLCEIKYTISPYSVSNEDILTAIRRKTRFTNETKTNKSIHLVLISACGVTQNANACDFQNILTEINLF